VHKLEIDKKVLQVLNITKKFGDGCPVCRENKEILIKNYCPHCQTIYACRNISFDLYEGEILGVVGESGSGKSTFVQCLYFDQKATNGEAYLSNYKGGRTNALEVSNQEKRYIKDYIMGMVYQNPFLGLKMNFSAISNVAEKLIDYKSR